MATCVYFFLPILAYENFRRCYRSIPTNSQIKGLARRTDIQGCTAKLLTFPVLKHAIRIRTKQRRWLVSFALDAGEPPERGGDQVEEGDDAPGLNRTRLGRIALAGGKVLLEKLNSGRRNFPMKVFLLLLGFYTANALATILGQTGDWDVLVAGVVVAAIEGIGMLMYRKPWPSSTRRLRYLVVMTNFWKAGVCLGLFVDAFKLGS